METRTEIRESFDGRTLVSVWLTHQNLISVSTFRIYPAGEDFIYFLIPLSHIREDTREPIVLGHEAMKIVMEKAAERAALERREWDEGLWNFDEDDTP